MARETKAQLRAQINALNKLAVDLRAERERLSALVTLERTRAEVLAASYQQLSKQVGPALMQAGNITILIETLALTAWECTRPNGQKGMAVDAFRVRALADVLKPTTHPIS